MNFRYYLYSFLKDFSYFKIGRKLLGQMCIWSQNKVSFKCNSCQTAPFFFSNTFSFSLFKIPVCNICFNKISGLKQLRNHITFLFFLIWLSFYIFLNTLNLFIPKPRTVPLMKRSNRLPFPTFINPDWWGILRIWGQFGVITFWCMSECWTVLIDLLNVLVVEQLTESWPLLIIHFQTF